MKSGELINVKRLLNKIGLLGMTIIDKKMNKQFSK